MIFSKTNFKVWDEVDDKDAKSSKINLTSSPILDVDMKSGDALWIPAYHPHLATSKTSRL